MKRRIVAITGANGFISSELIYQLLKKEEYLIRGSVRSLKETEKFEHLWTLSPDARSRLELFECDLMKEGSFDKLIEGSDAVLHLASPVTFAANDPQKEIVEPALKGTRNVLNSVTKYRNTVKRVVVTSSLAAMVNLSKLENPERVYDEKDWNLSSSLTDGPYRYSKRLAEEAAWEWSKETGIDLVTILPSFVLGRLWRTNTSIDQITFSMGVLRKLLSGEVAKVPMGGVGIVDVEDVAKSLILSLENNSAIGNRFFVCENVHSWKEVCQIANEKFPTQTKSPTGEEDPNQPFTITSKFLPNLSSSKVRNVLGLQFKPFQETIQTSIASLISNKFL